LPSPSEPGPLARARAALDAPYDAAALACFRVALGALICVSALRFFAYGWIDAFFVRPRFFFRYWGFAWVPVPGPTGVHLLFGAVAALGALLALGLAYRPVVVALFVAFTWVQLLDATNYLNHYYLVSLLLLLLCFMPLGRAWGIDALLWPRRRLRQLPAWMTWLLRFQVGCVYVFAGKAKLGADWLLHAQPLEIWLRARTDVPVVGAWFGERWVAYAFSWGGFLFDSTIVAFLLWRRTRVPAFVVLVVFHAITGALFPIGMFPVIMVVSALVFFSPSWPRALVARLQRIRGGDPGARAATEDAVEVAAAPPATSAGRLGPVGLSLAVGWCALQVLVPLRQHLYGGNVLWHEQGMRFSWKVMVREKNASVTFWVHDPTSGRRWYVPPRQYLDARQEREFAAQPDLVLQLAHRIAADERARGREVTVHAEVLASLNARRMAPMVDDTVDLAREPDGLGPKRWILPAPEGLPRHLEPRLR
jgi:vitamin K-dependent gamma-carboxylase